MKQRTILIAVDGSSRSRGVLRAGAELAGLEGARAVLYRGFAVPPEFPPAAATAGADPLPEILEQAAHAELTALLNEMPSTQCVVLVERVSQPWRGILAAAKKVDAEIIVVGSHGYHGWDHVLGTTAAKVANHARCSVFVVHDRSAGPASAEVPGES